MPSSFPGFPKEGFAFLKGLAKNNEREWFQARKSIYETSVKAPMEALIEALNSHLVRFAPAYVTDPRKALYRIYRDTRFSNDKTPYKTHIAASFSRASAEKHTLPGYYFSVSPTEIEVGGGMYMPSAESMRAVRMHLLEHHAELRKILSQRPLSKLLGGLAGTPLTRAPKGFPPDHPAIDLIRYKGWFLYDTRMDPRLALTPELLPELVKRFQALTPLVEFLAAPLSAKPKDPLLIR